MTEGKKTGENPHRLVMENRRVLTLTGVLEVANFDDSAVTLHTEGGGLVIKGENLHIGRLNVEAGDLQVEGRIDSLCYTEVAERGGFLRRLFR